ncbi:MAG: hydroxymethylbilane synthase [Halobacteriales archaeon]|nr:hydroxymethylbilane synthase [Halobacteriales archaeon]
MKLGTRGSDLALEQTRRVQDALRFETERVVVETSGDSFEGDVAELGKQGVFVRELDTRVVEGELDAAVHSMKDMPTERPEGLEVAAVLRRAPSHDVLVTPDGSTLEELDEGATVGTSSRRRKAQILRERDDLNVEGLRGNVDTRVEKVLDDETDYAAAVLSEAGLVGLGLVEEDEDEEDDEDDEEKARNREADVEEGNEREDDADGLEMEYERLPLDEFVPSANQGIVAVVAMDDTDAFERLTQADHKRTRVVATAERIVLSRVGGGCIAPIGVHATVQGDRILIRADVLSSDGAESVSLDRRYDVRSYIEGAEELADEMVERGADELLREAED